MKRKARLTPIVGMLFMLMLVGTAGYSYLLDLNLIDALYMTVITISTVGYAEVGIMDNTAKFFSIFIIFLSLGTVGYLFTSIVSSFLEGDLKDAWRRRKMESNLEKLKDHYIICGAGETGQNTIKQFKKSKVDFIVVELDEHKVNDLIDDNIFAIQGDATLEDTLSRARIKHTKGLISSLQKDADNVYIVLTAREMNEELYIVSRAIEKNAHEKLRRAGADNTISPNEIGGSRMASLMLRPTVISFLDIITHAGEVVLDLEEVTISKESTISGKSLKQTKIPEKTGLIVLAIRKANTTDLMFNPNSDVVLNTDDTLVVLGREEQVVLLKDLAMDTI